MITRTEELMRYRFVSTGVWVKWVVRSTHTGIVFSMVEADDLADANSPPLGVGAQLSQLLDSGQVEAVKVRITSSIEVLDT